MRAQKMPELNILRDPPGHRAGLVNEWKMFFLGGSDRGLGLNEFHALSSYTFSPISL